MKVIQVPFCFHPEPIGGTEIYVAALAKVLQKRGLTVTVAAPGKHNQTYIHQDLPVRQFPISSQLDLSQLYGQGDPIAAQSFGQLLDQECPNLVHLHAFTSASSPLLIQEAKKRNIPVVFTYHTPTVSCQRGTLLQWGKQICAGKLQLQDCSSCALHGLGLNRFAAQLTGQLPTWVGSTLGKVNLQGGPWTGLRMTELVALHQAAFHQLMGSVEHIIAVCEWVKSVLVLNQVPPDRISVIRQGLCYEVTDTLTSTSRNHSLDSSLHLAFLGRLHPTKGVHILIKAIRSLPTLPVHLDIYGVAQGDVGKSYKEQLTRLIGNDARIVLNSSLTQQKVLSTLSTYDLLAVPSQWLETGPMVVLEAFAAGVPVIGSNLGGITELVQDGVNGVLVEAACEHDWGQKLQALYQDRSKLESLRKGVSTPWTMAEVGDRILTLYKTIV
jgi:glycosyltransferase involved in cell wall biosynthesis